MRIRGHFFLQPIQQPCCPSKQTGSHSSLLSRTAYRVLFYRLILEQVLTQIQFCNGFSFWGRKGLCSAVKWFEITNYLYRENDSVLMQILGGIKPSGQCLNSGLVVRYWQGSGLYVLGRTFWALQQSFFDNKIFRLIFTIYNYFGVHPTSLLTNRNQVPQFNSYNLIEKI